MSRFTRRGFLGLLATGAVGACVAAKIPTSLLPAPVRARAACEFLREHYHAYCRGGAGRHPWAFLVGRELFEAYESELVAIEAFMEAAAPQIETLRFKGAAVASHSLTGLTGWDVMILTRDEWDRARARLIDGRPLEWRQNVA